MLQNRKSYNIVLVEDHSIFIEGLLSVLKKIENAKVLGAFVSGEEALAFLQTQNADIVFLDISLPGGKSGIEICNEISRLHRKTKVIALSNHTERETISEMLNNGASGYLLKNASVNDLENAIEQVMQGQCVMSEEIRNILFSPQAPAPRAPRLTAREKEILYWIGEGLTTTAIANKLFISVQTVESHRYNLLQKFDVPNAVVLVKKAIELGMMKEVGKGR
ncbi:DNA-binding response regulator, NarL/FixJ family, contains REC and HTH domains [Chitinophaga terrae (ex Kim and Jung 2007)]|jgi:DNA-binding NarL/FixJ family response regulator|uniref:DNA-binding response regulator, NarL/FixJ family, contains REC and HTH domains n=2 Tax=Chitinophaga terrae (ex Kim and Jung 2007) TaxID=408074 RepID=A0A1H4BYF9_9BACT|nr:response regulator transcription factor [Chitinophaga terrae (ex Kim and Jung 2007)]GEP91914.1 DNA-binding response regulator [Chitinophaga terrae (ex Kim and Jung 2007)]SEA53156.1 DNA-binding response regulator, NarL/FixJ family, contains REC and HTH domains [Chitinophaga terrae (ex Kim and Jung 2007)]